MGVENEKIMNDQQLVEGCLRGEAHAQHQLYNKYAGQMMAVCLRYGSDYEEAQDMFQEGFVKVYQKLHLYNYKGALGAWIRRTIVNNALDLLRKNKRENQHVSLYKVDYMIQSEGENDPFEEDEQIMSADQISKLISEMPNGYRTVFNLYVVEEYSHKEIAEQLGISESTSKTQYKKAKAFLKKLIEGEKKTAQ